MEGEGYGLLGGFEDFVGFPGLGVGIYLLVYLGEVGV